MLYYRYIENLCKKIYEVSQKLYIKKSYDRITVWQEWYRERCLTDVKNAFGQSVSIGQMLGSMK